MRLLITDGTVNKSINSFLHQLDADSPRIKIDLAHVYLALSNSITSTRPEIAVGEKRGHLPFLLINSKQLVRAKRETQWQNSKEMATADESDERMKLKLLVTLSFHNNKSYAFETFGFTSRSLKTSPYVSEKGCSSYRSRIIFIAPSRFILILLCAQQ